MAKYMSYQDQIMLTRWKQGFTMQAIADELHCNRLTVLRHLHKLNAPRRPPGPHGNYDEKAVPRHCWNAEWLRTEYWERGRSSVSLSKECGASPAGMLYRLRRLGIPTRNLSESAMNDRSRKIHLTDDLLSLLEGGLLGDGSISWSPGRQSATYAHGDKHRDFLLWLGKRLAREGIDYNGKIDARWNRFGDQSPHLLYYYRLKMLTAINGRRSFVDVTSRGFGCF